MESSFLAVSTIDFPKLKPWNWVFKKDFICVAPSTPYGFKIQSIQGFVKELVVNDDPEYQWIDKIRTPRASNEARQTLFSQLSGEVRRKIGLKVLELGGNAVVG